MLSQITDNVKKHVKLQGRNCQLANNNSNTDWISDYFDETKPGELDTAITQLFNSDTEEEDFEGFIDEQLIKCSACVSFVCLQLTIMIFALE